MLCCYVFFEFVRMHIDLEELCVALDTLAVLFCLDSDSDISVIHAWGRAGGFGIVLHGVW
jgi:hypothetical protein